MGARGKHCQELLRARSLPGGFLQPLHPSDLSAEEGPASAKREGTAGLAHRGPSSPQDGGESQGCLILSGTSLGGGFPAHHELPPALLYRNGSRQRGQEGTMRAEHSLGCTALSSNRTLGRLTYLLNLFRDKPNQMQAIYLPQHQFAS